MNYIPIWAEKVITFPDGLVVYWSESIGTSVHTEPEVVMGWYNEDPYDYLLCMQSQLYDGIVTNVVHTVEENE